MDPKTRMHGGSFTGGKRKRRAGVDLSASLRQIQDNAEVCLLCIETMTTFARSDDTIIAQLLMNPSCVDGSDETLLRALEIALKQRAVTTSLLNKFAMNMRCHYENVKMTSEIYTQHLVQNLARVAKVRKPQQ